MPFSKGGPTDVTNGSALCSRCNLIKGATMPISPRGWQQRFITKYHAYNGGDFLCVACPGAGKTLAAGFIARDLLRDGVIDRILVIVPSGPLRMQWHRALAKLGLLLDGSTMNNEFGEMPTIEGRRTHGWIVTYHSLTNDGMGHRILNARRRTLVILDEVHHLSVDKGRWGEASRHALEPCVRRLSLSGTPFRGDRGEIPFIEYRDGWARYRDDDDGTPYPRGFDYSYGTALAEHNPPGRISPVRPAVFEMYDGDVTWLEGDEGRQKQARISNPTLDLKTRRKAKRHVVNPAGDWLRDALAAADRRLTMVREEGDGRAKGLVICYDTDHAHEVAKVLASVVGGREVFTAVSKDISGDDSTEQARRIIERFGTSSARWLVAVAMVSEGVDIPQLRVGVYATVVRSELFFRQVLGRFVRRVSDLPDEVDQTAYLFVPKDPEMVGLADGVLEEVTTAVLRDDEDEDICGGPEGPRQPKLNLDAFISTTSEAAGILVPGKGSADHDLVERIATESGQAASSVACTLAAMEKLGLALPIQGAAQPAANAPAYEASYLDRIKGRKNQLETGLRQLAGAMQRRDGGEYREIIARLKKQVYDLATIRDYRRADLPQIDEAVRIVRKLWDER